MANSKNNEGYIKALAGEILGIFAKIADTAKSELADSPSGSGIESIANMNTFTSQEAIRNKERVSLANIEGYRKLAKEPANARVVVIDENKKRATYYICRATLPQGIDRTEIKLASYRAPAGKLASYDVGDEVPHPGNQAAVVEIIEKAELTPIRDNGEWDSQRSQLISKAHGILTIESLRALLKKRVDRADETDTAEIDRLLDEGGADENIRKGFHRRIITKIDLRDQPILDRYQDDIFRLPLNSRLLILGAPGTGKTTTLIRRLGQKLDHGYLDENEVRLVNGLGIEIDHSQSWIMFTPTELLKLYVKEAFNREGIPAPDSRIKTWTDYRREVARNTFHILQSASGKRSYVMRESAQTLNAQAFTEQIDWFTDFDEWQRQKFSNEMRASAESLSNNPTEEVAQLGRKILATWESAGSGVRPRIFVELMAMLSEIRETVEKLKGSSDRKIRGALNLQHNTDPGFVEDLVSFVKGLSKLNDDPEDTDDQDAEAEEEDEPNQPRVGRAGALTHLMRAIRAQARARARGRNVSKKTRAGELIAWLGDRTLSDQDLKETGKSLIVQSELRKFINPVRRYINGIPMRYRLYRIGRQKENRWYPAEGFRPTDVHPLEVDIILLAMIRGTDELIEETPALGNESSPGRATLERLQHLYHTQVLVDEATDFSPIQLACMATLARPGIRSFFACGDFNQRVTKWGTQSDEQMKWAVPKIGTRTITTAYRQSRQLHDLAKQIADLPGGSTNDAALSKYAENEGVRPVLATHMAEESENAKWLAKRIQEIEKLLGELPSIAVLVNSEEKVQPLATELEQALAEANITVIPCPNGQVRGSDSAVRVFNIEHIKGLEFEAAFFIGLDRLAEVYPELFQKYLYVGATRAATYLGITCEQTLPPDLAGLQKLFGETWA